MVDGWEQIREEAEKVQDVLIDVEETIGMCDIAVEKLNKKQDEEVAKIHSKYNKQKDQVRKKNKYQFAIMRRRNLLVKKEKLWMRLIKNK